MVAFSVIFLRKNKVSFGEIGVAKHFLIGMELYQSPKANFQEKTPFLLTLDLTQN